MRVIPQKTDVSDVTWVKRGADNYLWLEIKCVFMLMCSLPAAQTGWSDLTGSASPALMGRR